MSATANKKIQGIFTPILIPFDDRGQINEPELRRFVNWLIDHGVHGLYPNGSSGEFTRFTPAERRRILEIVADENRGRLPIIAGAAEANVKETLAACEVAAKLGARAVAIVAPFYYKLTPESVYAYFAEIARSSPIDLTLYNIPMFASPIDVPTVRRLAEEFPRVIGIKDSTGDLAFMMRLISQIRPSRPDFTFLTGWEAVLVPMLMIGCDGGTHASSNVVPEVTRKIYDLARGGNLDAAMKWQFRLLELFDAMLYPFEFPVGFKAAAELRGFHFGTGRLPLTAQQQTEYEALSKVLACILADFELINPPAQGCPPGAPSKPGSPASLAGRGEKLGLGGSAAANIGPEHVQQLVHQVLDEMKNRGIL